MRSSNQMRVIIIINSHKPYPGHRTSVVSLLHWTRSFAMLMSNCLLLLLFDSSDTNQLWLLAQTQTWVVSDGEVIPRAFWKRGSWGGDSAFQGENIDFDNCSQRCAQVGGGGKWRIHPITPPPDPSLHEIEVYNWAVEGLKGDLKRDDERKGGGEAFPGSLSAQCIRQVQCKGSCA